MPSDSRSMIRTYSRDGIMHTARQWIWFIVSLILYPMIRWICCSLTHAAHYIQWCPRSVASGCSHNLCFVQYNVGRKCMNLNALPCFGEGSLDRSGSAGDASLHLASIRFTELDPPKRAIPDHANEDKRPDPGDDESNREDTKSRTR